MWLSFEEVRTPWVLHDLLFWDEEAKNGQARFLQWVRMPCHLFGEFALGTHR
jgi:hypothetical protein